MSNSRTWLKFFVVSGDTEKGHQQQWRCASTVQESHAEQSVGGAVVLLDEHPIWLDVLENIRSSKGIWVIGNARRRKRRSGYWIRRNRTLARR
jgi:hypothetical protein